MMENGAEWERLHGSRWVQFGSYQVNVHNNNKKMIIIIMIIIISIC